MNNQEEAQNAFMINVEFIKNKLELIKSEADDFFGNVPEDVDWSTAGNVIYVNHLLGEIMEFLNIKDDGAQNDNQ